MIQMPQVKMDYFACQGGLNTMSPPLTMPPGFAITAQNFECLPTGGYRRIYGYERFDGRVSPSDQLYYTLPATITGTWAVGNTVTGATSGATARILGSSDTGFLVCKITGTFNGSESLTIGGTPVATNTGSSYVGGAGTTSLDANFIAATADVYRADIGAVPGSGPVRGVWAYGGVLYAFRNNAGGTACDMYKSTASGWSQVTFVNEVAFTAGGTATPADGATLTQGGVTATVRRVVTRAGAWTGTAAGIFVISAPSGGNFAAGAATLTGGATVTLSGIQTAITLPAGGRYIFTNYNFGGATGSVRMYGANGVGRAFEFDGTYLVPIGTGMGTDTPSFIAAHKSHLFLAFNSSLQHSSIGNPYAWSPVSGAAELALGDTITGLQPHVGDASNAALVATTRNRVYVLYGTSSADWNLITTAGEMGGLPYTQQKVGDMFWLDDRGVTSMAAAFQFGNFQQGTISPHIQDWILGRVARAVDSTIHRGSNQYRLFFSDGSALYVTLGGGKVVGMMPMLFPDVPTCSCSNEWSTGVERVFFGDSDGYVYEMEKGTSFDGAAIEAFFEMAFNHIKAPQIQKRYRKVVIEMRGLGYTEALFGYSLGYASTTVAQPDDLSISSSTGASFTWDSFTWDSFFWDVRSLSPIEKSITGSGENISLAFRVNSTYVQPFTVTGFVLHYTPRRRIR